MNQRQSIVMTMLAILYTFDRSTDFLIIMTLLATLNVFGVCVDLNVQCPLKLKFLYICDCNLCSSYYMPTSFIAIQIEIKS